MLFRSVISDCTKHLHRVLPARVQVAMKPLAKNVVSSGKIP